MDNLPLERFETDQDGNQSAVEASGHRWTVYWLLADDTERCYMTDGNRHAEIINPHEWQVLHMEASAVGGDEEVACDLACERLRRLMELRGQWIELE